MPATKHRRTTPDKVRFHFVCPLCEERMTTNANQVAVGPPMCGECRRIAEVKMLLDRVTVLRR